MGYEMGNNNVSGLQEDEKARSVEAQSKISKEEISANELNRENHKEPEAEEKKLHEKQNFDEKEDTLTRREGNTSPPGDGRDLNEVVFCSETPLVASEPQVENETSDEKDKNDIQSNPLSTALEIAAELDDAPDLGVGVQDFAASDISDLSARDTENHEKRKLDENLITEDEHRIEKEITNGRENNETDPTDDSNARSHNLEPDSDQHEVHFDEAGCGSSLSQRESEELIGLNALAQSENGHLVINEMAGKMYLCVIPEDEDNQLVEANVSKEEACQRTFNEAKVCDGDESPLDTLQSPPEAPNSAEEASDLQLEASKSSVEASEMPFLQAVNSLVETLEPPQEASKSPVEASEVPLVEVVNSPMETVEPPLEASESSVELSNSQLEAVTSLESSEPPLEALNSALFNGDLRSPLEASDPPVQAIKSLPKTSNSPLEVSELAVEASKSQTEALETPVEASKSPPDTSESPWEALDSSLEPLESQPEAFLQPSSINSCQEFYEPQDKIIDVPTEAKLIANEMENGETELDRNQAQFSGENDKYSECSEFNASLTESMSVNSNCKNNEHENASNSSIEDFLASEPVLDINGPQIAVVNQTLMLCFEEQPKMEKSMLLTEETKSVVSVEESKDNEYNHNKTELSDKDVKNLKTDDFIASHIEFMSSETEVQRTGEQSALKFSSIYSIGKDCQLENLEVNLNEVDVSFLDKNLEQLEESYEVNADRVSELKAVPTESTVTESTREEDMTGEEIDAKCKQSLPSENNAEKGDTVGQFMWPNSNQQARDLPSHFSDSEAAEKNKLISGSSGFSVIAENSNASLSNATDQSLVTTKEELQKNIQATSMMAGETEARPVMFDDQIDKTPETVEKLMTESSSERSHVEFRKSPSFHFDLSIGARAEESDQTPLLSHDMITGRSLSSRGNTMSQKGTAQTDYSSPQDEALLVVEKTIRMERSDSERPSTPFLSLIQKEEIAEASVTTEKQQENFGADKKRKKDTWTVIHKTFALTSPRDSNGTRKSMSSIFSTCICCAAKIP